MADALRPHARGGQGLPERRAPAGEPVAGTEVRVVCGPTRC